MTAAAGTLFDSEHADRRWRQRVRAARATVPRSATAAPNRSVYCSTASGTAQIYAWNRATDHRWRITDHPTGVVQAAITPDGESIWWFADHMGDEVGRWMRTPFPTDPATEHPDTPATAEPALPEIPEGYDAGLRLGSGVVVLGVGAGSGSSVWRWRPGAPAEVLQHRPDTNVVGLSTDGALAVLTHAEDGVSQGVQVISTQDGAVIGDLTELGQQLTPLGLRPNTASTELLVAHQRHGRTGLLLWSLDTGTETELDIALEGEVAGQWYPDGAALLLVHHHAARSTLHRLDLTTARHELIPTPPGSIDEARLHAGGDVEFSWSSGSSPWQVRRVPGALRRGATPTRGEATAEADTRAATVVLGPRADEVPTSEPLVDHWVPGPGGTIHTLVARPPGQHGPLPTVFRLHGGPHVADQDSWHAMRAAWLDAGFQVVHVNFRGSTGYGATWRDAIIGRPGLTELDDVMAVQQWAVDTGLAQPNACIAEGYSWGGMLSLLAVSRHPDAWAAAIGGLPVADAAATYHAQMEPLKAGDRALYGGAPDEVPEAYLQASPSSYVDQVRAPVLLLAGRYDPRCPIAQVESYAAALREAGARCELRIWDIGHGPQDAALVEEFVLATVPFARSAISAGQAGTDHDR